VLTRELMQQALEALDGGHIERAYGYIQEALAQPEQKPVAWVYTSKWRGNERFITHFQTDLSTYKAEEVWPLYTTPPRREWAGLTDEYIDKTMMDHGFDADDESITEMLKYVEAKLKEKNL
jgi:hypothetical protein